jgi:zinc transport system substrate-binding protein
VVLGPAQPEGLLTVPPERVEDVRLSERGERPVDGGEPSLDAGGPKLVVEVLGRHGLGASFERLEDGEALLRHAEAGAAEGLVHEVQSTHMKMRMLLIWLLIASTACSPEPADDGKLSVVASFFPIADAVEWIGGSEVKVTNLTPPGVEPHDLELTTDAMDALVDADLIFYIGGGFQPGFEDAVRDVPALSIDLLEDARTDDPHIWLDPVRWRSALERMIDVIKERDGVEEIRDGAAGAHSYLSDTTDLIGEYDHRLASCERDLIVTAHAAFGALAKRYGLRQESIAGVSPEAEPNPKRLAELADLVKEEDVTTIFTEELVSPKVAAALAREAGVKTAVLDPIESEPEGGYFGAMRRNLDVLREALGCR